MADEEDKDPADGGDKGDGGGGELTAEQIASAKAEIAQANEELDKKRKDIEDNSNWKKFRARDERLSKVLEEKGIKVDEDGNIVSEKPLAMDDVRKEADAAAERKFINIRKDELLGEIEDVEDRKLVDHYFQKLTAGETISIQNVKSFVKSATRAAFADDDTKLEKVLSATSGGRPPRQVEKDSVDEERIKQLAAGMGLPIEVPKK